MNRPLRSDVIAEVAQALYAVQDRESATRASRAEVVSRKRAEIEAVLGALYRAGVVALGQELGGEGAIQTNRLISRQQVGELFGLRRSATYELTRRPDFPPPVVLSSKCLRWPVDEVVAFAEKLRPKEARQPMRRVRAGRANGDVAWPVLEGRLTGRVRPARPHKAR